MATKRAPKWMHFGEFFETVSIRGLYEPAAAEALHAALKGGVEAFGYRRRYVIEDEKREILPRDTQPQRVPLDLWEDAGELRSDMTSYWCEHPEKVRQFIHVDWISGSMESYVWTHDFADMAWRDYHNIRIAERDAAKLLSSLAGTPARRKGRPSGPSSSWERERVKIGLSLLAAGDARPVAQIAAELTDPQLDARAFELQKRRITAGLKAETTATEKPAHN